MNGNDNSGLNTVLLVIVLLVIVGAAVWYFTRTGVEAPTQEEPGLDIDVNLPAENQGGENQQQ